ncbi:lipoyl(octanoyl) transferase LipB [uncultured Alistipes sp.]|uniref:lipoyl(octanoyl) transferase LipB n=1 Tax=uncultured Alistipes sp. TaxID=538949 RepID=UPI002614EA7D|nr:lipoyl(octanoyl) transferase LipB [uncultured Alistipes sp.]
MKTTGTVRAACRDLGVMDYKACWELQQRLFDALVSRKRHGAGQPEGPAAQAAPHSSDSPAAQELPAAEAGTVLLVEHPPVYTLGKSGHAENLLVSRETLEGLGATFFHIDRGGDITFHGPGQLVCYPILDLERLGIGLREYIAALEEAVIRTVAHYGIRAGRIAGASGVWLGQGVEFGDKGADGSGRETVSGAEIPNGEKETPAAQPPRQVLSAAACGGKIDPPRKICAIGVRSSRYVTMHGFALNVTTDLGWFSRINPCGFTDRGATSIARETGRSVAMDEVKDLVVKFLSEILNVKIYKY